MAEKEAKVKVVTEPDLKGAKAIEDKINELKAQRLRMKIDADTSALNEVSSKLNETESKLEHLRQMRIQQNITVDDGQIEALESDVERLRQQKINLQIQVEEGKLEEVQYKKDAIEDDPIKINLDNQSAMQGIEQISQGFDRLKQGASGVGQQLGSVLESAGRMEQTEAFLSMNMGADKAKQKLEEIREVTDSLPGDDVALQNLLSQAAIQDANMGIEAFKQMGTAAADYMAAMENFGKTSKETQQDLMNYILAGNTAELQGSPILQDKIDKLKEGTTVQERSKLLAEALNEAHWGGITGIETYNVKMQKFTDMLERGKMNLGGMFQEGAKWGMDFLMQLDESTEGLVGMTIAAAGFAAPITDSLMGLGQMASGVRAIKDAADFTGITSKLGDLKTKLLDVGSAAKTAALNFLNFSRTLITNAIQAAKDAALALADLGKKVLEAGYNALKTVGMWIAEKAAKAASTLASYAMAAAQ